MTDHYFENELVNLHYYKFGNGPETMLCFHGYGMHGKQFRLMETDFGAKYTFYGFDLFFHKETRLKDQSLATIKKGIDKKTVADLITDFCRHIGIDRFSVIAYSMGTHYATTVVEEMAGRVNEYILAAPMCFKPGNLISFFSKNKTGNRILEKLVLSETALLSLLKLCKRLRAVDDDVYQVLFNEIATDQLRLNFYACFTYLRFLEADANRLIQAVNWQNIKSIFIFGKRDRNFPPGIGSAIIEKLNNAEVVILDESHEMIKKSFVTALKDLLL